MAFALAGGELLRFAAKANEAGLELHTSFCGPFRPMTESWTRFFAQGVKWKFCLTAGKIRPQIRRDHEEESAPEPLPGLQGKSGTVMRSRSFS